MNFDYNEGEKEFNKYVKKIIGDKIKPEYSSWRAEDTTPKRMFELLGEAQLLGFRIVENKVEPIPWLQNIHYYKEMAQFSGGIAIASFVQGQLGSAALYFFANDQQKSEYLMPGVLGKKIIAFANTEPDAGSDAAGIKLTAEDMGDHFLVNGTKSFITNGDLADHIIFTALTHPKTEKRHGRISMLLVDGDATGLERLRLKKLPWKTSHLSVLNYKDVKVPKINLIGEPKR
ncbi:MAG: acyl-CoA dehydrogenase family protein, partial [Thermoplasmata archaeon]|nr:acyl-CoA dehydrogenase family protein [Thermoplasmata archaeon]